MVSSDRPRPVELVELPKADCLKLLTGCRFGRVVTAIDGKPLIRPVNYVFDERSQSVAFRTAYGVKLYELRHVDHAMFEIDEIDPVARAGWSVIISGTPEEVTHPAEVRRLERLGLDVWAPGPRPHWIRIGAWTVSGRKIVLG
jgi:nitroimidazol reductase NimA-like FMN-containing flavoprotein (pyridoxamine 5'-phosphate oxidase superfamily)